MRVEVLDLAVEVLDEVVLAVVAGMQLDQLTAQLVDLATLDTEPATDEVADLTDCDHPALVP